MQDKIGIKETDNLNLALENQALKLCLIVKVWLKQVHNFEWPKSLIHILTLYLNVRLVAEILLNELVSNYYNKTEFRTSLESIYMSQTVF